MKICMNPTTRISRSPMGIGRVWEGQTEQGTPVKVLVSGLAAGSDDPALAAQFDREHEELPVEDGPKCPDCGEPLEYHVAEVGGEAEMRRAEVDLYEVVARWLMASDNELAPPGVTEAGVAEHFRNKLEALDPGAHKRLMKAAGVVTRYVAEQILGAAEPVPSIHTHHRPGHA